MVLTEENYYSAAADEQYMSVSQYKDFVGTYGRIGCEYTAMEKLSGRYAPEPSTAMQVGSFVDEYFTGDINKYKAENPQIFTKTGGLRSEFKNAEYIIERIKQSEYFLKYLSGEKQVIMTADLFGTPWKIKMDSYLTGVAIVDLKILKTISKAEWVKDIGYIDQLRYWGYDIQGAVYQKVVELNTGSNLPFYLAVATKEEEPDLQIIQITQNYLDEALMEVEYNLPRVLMVKNGESKPDRCERCPCCRKSRVLTHPITLLDLLQDV